MKPTPYEYQDWSGMQLHTRFQLLAYSLQQAIIICELPYTRRAGTRVEVPLQISMRSFINAMCANYHLDPTYLVIVLSCVPLEQVANCEPNQLLQVSWEGWHYGFFRSEARGIYWRHASAQQLQQWQQLASRA